MTAEWTPQLDVTPELATRTVGAQFPELAGLPVRDLDAGWDNRVVAVGDHLLFRFVHREMALPGAARELVVLRALPALPLPTPRPTWLGTPTPEVPWPFWGAARLPGDELASTPLDDDARVPLGRALGEFLRALHDPALADAVRTAADDRQGLLAASLAGIDRAVS